MRIVGGDGGIEHVLMRAEMERHAVLFFRRCDWSSVWRH